MSITFLNFLLYIYYVKFRQVFSLVNALKMHDSMNAILHTLILTSLVQKYVDSVNAVDDARDLFFFFFDMGCSFLGRESKLLIKYISTSFLRCEFSC